MINDSFIFYQSFLSAIECLPSENQLHAYQYITRYALQWITPEANEDAVAYAIFLMAKPQIDANIDRRINGNKWWAKPWNQNARKNWNVVENWEKQLKQPLVDLENNWKQPNVNVNVNDNVNVEEKEMYKEKEISPKKLFGTIVELTQEEYDRLATKFWEGVVKKYIINMDSYCVEHNKRYKDYNLALQKWIAKDNVKEKPPEKKQLSEFEIEEWVYDLEKMFKT